MMITAAITLLTSVTNVAALTRSSSLKFIPQLQTGSRTCRSYYSTTSSSSSRYYNEQNLNQNQNQNQNHQTLLVKQLKRLHLNEYITPLEDLGYFGLAKRGSDRRDKCSTYSPITSIQNNVDHTKTPPLITNSMLKKIIEQKLPYKYNNPQAAVTTTTTTTTTDVITNDLFPYRFRTVLASLYVIATKKKNRAQPSIQFKDIDFAFGSYTLHFLATGKLNDDVPNDSEKCIIAKIPGTSIILITRHKIYTHNSSLAGAQLERLLCDDDDMQSTAKESWNVIHHYLFDIGNVTVLLPAEVDALYCTDSRYGSLPMEIKNTAYGRRYASREQRTMFQMISSTSQFICEGASHISLDENGQKQNVLREIKVRTLEEYSKTVVSKQKMIYHGKNIQKRVQWLQRQSRLIEDGQVYELSANYRNMITVVPNPPFSIQRSANITIETLFPNKEIIQELLGN